ncbi:hypothetical protein [Fodinicola acaciae]|uniref:hypothetical protein n=1 Tax=Fodinicola acaciae TaxID=2681555 RepID=UPI0013D75949|nr:hypothetical protein [Fodinicola acaciae]
MVSPADFTDVRERAGELAGMPDLVAIRRRGRSRRRLRRTGALMAPAAAAIVVGAVLAGTIVVTHPGDGATERELPAATAPWTAPAGNPPSLPAPIHGSLRGAPVDPGQRMQLLQTSTPDAWRSYSLAKLRNAHFALIRTLDGGRSWQGWTLPAAVPMAVTVNASESSIPPPSEPAGPVAGPGQTVVVGEPRTGEFVSRDGGQSWAPMPKPGAPVAAVPPGWAVIAHAEDPNSTQLRAIDPTTGTPHPLRNQIGGSLVTQGPDEYLHPSTDGTYWAITTRNPNRTELVISRDGAKSWTVAFSQRQLMHVDAYDTEHAYAVGTVSARPAVFVAHDRATRWSPAAARNLPAGTLTGVVALPHGGLVVALQTASGRTQLWTSHDQGESFRRVYEGGDIVWFGRTATGGLAAQVTTRSGDKYAPATWIVSENGTDWHAGLEPPNVFVVPYTSRGQGG